MMLAYHVQKQSVVLLKRTSLTHFGFKCCPYTVIYSVYSIYNILSNLLVAFLQCVTDRKYCKGFHSEFQTPRVVCSRIFPGSVFALIVFAQSVDIAILYIQSYHKNLSAIATEKYYLFQCPVFGLANCSSPASHVAWC